LPFGWPERLSELEPGELDDPLECALTRIAVCPTLGDPKLAILRIHPTRGRRMRALTLVLPALLAFCLLAESAAAEKVELLSGDTLEGEIIESNEKVMVMQHPVLGRLEIPVEEIKPKEGIKPGLFDTWFLRGWNRSFSFGYAGSSGKTKETAINTDLELHYKSESHRIDNTYRYYYSRQNGQTNNNEADILYLHDFLIADTDFFPFLSASYRYDAMQEWNHRVGGNTGIGYTVIDDGVYKVLPRIGGGVARTFVDDRPCIKDDTGVCLVPKQTSGSDPVRWEYNFLLGLQLGWVIMEGMKVTWDTVYLLDVGDSPNFRLTSRAEYKVAIGYVEGLGFKTGIAYIYDAHESTSARNDRKWYVNIVYDF
jgi:putative salt-induced outer membrane protein YdiY